MATDSEERLIDIIVARFGEDHRTDKLRATFAEHRVETVKDWLVSEWRRRVHGEAHASQPGGGCVCRGVRVLRPCPALPCPAPPLTSLRPPHRNWMKAESGRFRWG